MTDKEQQILVNVEGINRSEIDSLIDDLTAELQRAGFPQSSRLREDDRTQDFGATLVLVLGTPAVITAIKAIRDWSARKNAGIIIRRKNGEVIAKGLESKDMAEVAKAIVAEAATEKG
jgi:hypothetical protein